MWDGSVFITSADRVKPIVDSLIEAGIDFLKVCWGRLYDSVAREKMPEEIANTLKQFESNEIICFILIFRDET